MMTWQPTPDKRPEADDVYQRRQKTDEKPMRNNTMRQVKDAKEMNNHLTDDSDSAIDTANDTA